MENSYPGYVLNNFNNNAYLYNPNWDSVCTTYKRVLGPLI